jgi:hypothetical protein
VVIRPVGPAPPSVYWVRRLLVLVVVLALVALVWWLLSGSGNDAAPSGTTAPAETTSAVATPTPSTSPEPTKSKKQTTAAPKAPPCDDADIEVVATTDLTAYPPNANPTFTLAVENTSDAACLRDIGQEALELRVSSGGAKIWSSDDCSPGGAVKETVLEPAEPFVQALTWGRQLSEAGCPTPLEPAPAGDYQLVGRNLDVLSEPDAFTLQE